MTASIKSLGIDHLPVEERLMLVEEIWDNIAADAAAVSLTDAQRAELQSRIEEDDANPDDVDVLGASQSFHARTSTQMTLAASQQKGLRFP